MIVSMNSLLESPNSSTHERNHMLILSRKRNEYIVINNNITVVVLEIRGDKVRLGIECSKDIPVHRKEVWVAIEREKQRNLSEQDESKVD